MEKIKLQVSGNQIEVVERPAVITAGTVGLPVEFTFDSQWDDLGKIQVFKAGDRAITGVSNVVPWEVLEKPDQWLYIGVYGANAQGTVVIPTLWAQIAVVHTGTNPEGDPALEPTAPLWQELMCQVENISPYTIGATPIQTTEELDQQVQQLDCLVGETAWKVNDHIYDVENNPHNITPARIGAAPAGYGLGETASKAQSWNGHYSSGFYRERKYTPTNPTSSSESQYPYWYGVTCVESSSNQAQIAFSTDISGGLIEARRYKKGNAFGEWEYVNPPMLEGVEYRTTERYLGKPVYAKLVSLGQVGSVPQNVTIASGVTEIVDASIRVFDGETTYFENQYLEWHIAITNGFCGCVFSSGSLEGCTAKVIAKYTKE